MFSDPVYFYLKKKCAINLINSFNVRQEGDARDFVENSIQIFSPLIKEKIAKFTFLFNKGKQIIYDPKLYYNKNEIKVVLNREGALGYIFIYKNTFLKEEYLGKIKTFLSRCLLNVK